jgi:hypothetical protein
MNRFGGTATNRTSTGYLGYRPARPASSVFGGPRVTNGERFTFDAAPLMMGEVSVRIVGQSSDVQTPVR